MKTIKSTTAKDNDVINNYILHYVTFLRLTTAYNGRTIDGIDDIKHSRSCLLIWFFYYYLCILFLH